MRGLEITHNCTLFMKLQNRKGVSSPAASPIRAPLSESGSILYFRTPSAPWSSVGLLSLPHNLPSLQFYKLFPCPFWFQLVKLYPCRYGTKLEEPLSHGWVLWPGDSCESPKGQSPLGKWKHHGDNYSTDFSYKSYFAWVAGMMSILWKCCSLVQCNCK